MLIHQHSCSLYQYVCVLACAAGITACVDLVDAGDMSLQQASSAAKDCYYTYEGEAIYLNIDPSRITLSAAASVPDEVIRSSLFAAGLDGTEMIRSPAQGDTFNVGLSSKTSVDDAIAVVTRLRGDKAFDFVANTYRTKEAGEALFLHNRLVVHLQDGAGAREIERLNREAGTRIIHESRGGASEYVLQYPPHVDPLDFALLIAERPEVEWVDPDKTSERSVNAIPSDPYFADQYYARSNLSRNGVRVDTNVEWAWDLTHGAWSAAAGPLIVAVVDQGVQTAHPELDSAFTLGYDTFTNSWSSFGCVDCATNPESSSWHGTAVAGIIKSQHNNGAGLAGLAPDVTLLPIRMFRNGFSASDSQIAMGIDAAWQNNAQVLNNSWGGGLPSNAITAAINRATTQGRGGKGAVVVFAAGNGSSRQLGIVAPVAYPARLPNVIAAGAINRSGELTDYTPEGSELDIVALGDHFAGACAGDIVTTDLLGLHGCNDGPQGNIDYTGRFAGTSAAAAQVAAVAAMVISRTPTLTESQVRSIITTNADPWGLLTQFGAGKLNAYRALVGRTRVTISGNLLPPTPGFYTYTANASGGVGGYVYQWSISYNGGPFTNVGANTSSHTVGVARDDRINLAVTVTNGPDSLRVTMTRGIVGPPTCSPACPM